MYRAPGCQRTRIPSDAPQEVIGRLGLSVLAGQWMGGTGTRAMVTAAQVFIPIWLAAALVNRWMGTRAGYAVAEELPIVLVIVAAPAAVALFIWWTFASAQACAS